MNRVVNQHLAEIPIRVILDDGHTYPDPSTLNPDRFITGSGKLDPSVSDPRAEAAFGCGQRIWYAWPLVSATFAEFSCLVLAGARDHLVEHKLNTGCVLEPSVKYVSGIRRYRRQYFSSALAIGNNTCQRQPEPFNTRKIKHCPKDVEDMVRALSTCGVTRRALCSKKPGMQC